MNLSRNIVPIILTVFFLSTATSTSAQPKAFGSSWSFRSIGIEYEFITSPDSFIHIDAGADMTGVFTGNDKVPGAAASFTWNMIFSRSASKNGCDIYWFAGPGVTFGWSKDRNSLQGLIFGIKGRIGMECLFNRNIAISLSFSPILGMHASGNQEVTNMRLYKNGLLYGLLPEIGIKYSFGK